MPRLTPRCLIVSSAALVAAAAGAQAQVGPISFGPGDYDNTPNTVTSGPVQHLNQTSGLFRDVMWWSTRNSAAGVNSADYINRGNSLVLSGNHAVFGQGPYTALNFTGNAPSGGQSYMAIYDTTPGDITQSNTFDAGITGGITVGADVLFAHPGHSVSGGVVAMFSGGQDALAFVVHQGGGNNADHARVELISQAGGIGTQLASINLPGLTTFVNAQWYRVEMQLSVVGDTWTMNGTIWSHLDPTNPNSALAGSPLLSVPLSGSLTSPGNAFDLTNPGEVGVIAQANQSFSDGIANPLLPTVDNLGVSITNFQVTPAPGAAGLLALAGLGAMRRRRA